jgi:hypothetical protein
MARVKITFFIERPKIKFDYFICTKNIFDSKINVHNICIIKNLITNKN